MRDIFPTTADQQENEISSAKRFWTGIIHTCCVFDYLQIVQISFSSARKKNWNGPGCNALEEVVQVFK